MPLERALIKLNEAGANLSYRPDQLPDLAIRVPRRQAYPRPLAELPAPR